MKIRILLPLLIGMPLYVKSQVSLNASMIPPVPSTFIYYDAQVPSPPFVFSKTGTNNTWDFTAHAPITEDTSFYVSPSSIPGGSTFTGATHCTYESVANPAYFMLKATTTGVNYIGVIADPFNNGIKYNLTLVPPTQGIVFPYTYGSSLSGSAYFQLRNSGAAVNQPLVDSVKFKETIIASRTVIATGNMIIPSGTFPAMLEKVITTRIDSAWIKGLLTFGQWIAAPGYPTSHTDSSFFWYTNNSLQAYAHVIYTSGNISNVNYLKSSTLVGIAEIPGFTQQAVYPNPVSDVLNLNVPFASEDTFEYTFYDISGQKVMNGITVTRSLNVKLLKSGIYFLQLRGTNGIISTTKFVKE